MARTSTDGFTAQERAAMKERAAELREQKGGKKKEANLQAVIDKIAEMASPDQEIAAGVQTLVSQLEAKTWYGMPAWAKDGDGLLFVQPV